MGQVNDTMAVHLIVNGKDSHPMKRREVELIGIRCVESCNPPVLDEGIISTDELLWSNPASWPSGKVPVEDEEVEIKSIMNIILDVTETPIFKKLEINGRLTFKNDMAIHLRSKNIFVRAGELIVGTQDAPYLEEG